ncbi:hypothetical protein GPLA_1996 [Paraglaciecola polaris LMG 21857]|uniref:Uncharacterized protein n=1 Tax=Paraglaciecola polaris LMG 21857 TaxID=1129793 RepID=K6ZVT7_9ALTE|nr:hypothetical protein GPLA_1996 [Paraglaciecola polaris LMG 21857]
MKSGFKIMTQQVNADKKQISLKKRGFINLASQKKTEKH